MTAPDSPAVAAARSVARARRLAGDASAPRIEIGSGRPGGFEAAPAGKRASEPREAASDDSGAIATDLSETGGPSSVGGSVPAPDSAAAASGDADPYGATPGPSGRSQPESAAARLRAAADLLEQRAAAATPGPWLPEYAGMSGRVQAVFVECDGEDCTHDRYGHADGTCAIGSFDESGDNRWSVLANPKIARPLAALLRHKSEVAALAGQVVPAALKDGVMQQLSLELAVADAILAGAS